MDRLILNLTTREKRVAVIENDQVVQFIIQQPQSNSVVGNVYIGRVMDVIPGIQAAFVDIGIDKNAYISREKLLSYQNLALALEDKMQMSISQFVHQGQEILVQVTKDSSELKGPTLSEVIELQGEYLIYLPESKTITISRKIKNEKDRKTWQAFTTKECTENEGLIVRTSCENQDTADVLKELQDLRTKYKKIIDMWKTTTKKPSLLYERNDTIDRVLETYRSGKSGEIIVDDFSAFQNFKGKAEDGIVKYYNGKENIFSHYGIEFEIENALKRTVWLESGAYLVIDNTEAMTVIDVNTGKFQGKSSLRDTVLKTNVQAAKEVARQLRLRDISGMILVDFIDMGRRQSDKQLVIDTIKTSLQRDPMVTKVLGFTSLGILELTRKKVQHSLDQTIQITCPMCKGTGRQLSPESIAFRLERELWELRGMEHEAIWIEAPKTVIDFVKGTNNEHLERLQEALMISIYITERSTENRSYSIRHIGSKMEIEERIKK
ncbi:Rne/Rng family ribonuclease [Cytobacillus sp. S13-E01]|uniref:Rne/Rng family ribonuclease n=1 Tax=Cytobacillus sp. S13-E01 TaxID=3031326 RepID=UPI0023D8AE64|nr:Rne/Rng family ribonuclease [Cytobacillus sp. S13-E01]MDF0726774.1 Rne/Rng family ribonuclease [Cytobacillus sp. S13-E01]